ncbi:hypothetical protein LTR56_014719 [Elasticomyces elasticus]|nr:hypothetical protein LTR56_014719 [Elasticomyces elasticus]KAK3645483.1 hypothetical protein LTR22_014745 [Elasticomyces elasticus]KAK4915839.1 hypothetical protein LTR49_016097 [Elasticomyces elasticus]KAK5755565.1 hypothetical protein LTS12_014321 [Elasticomyces elasticus]
MSYSWDREQGKPKCPRKTSTSLPTTESSDTYTVLVGAEREALIAPKDVLCRGSKYLTAACSTSWQHGENKTVTVEDVRPTTMRVYLRWKNTGRVRLEYEDLVDASGPVHDDMDGEDEWQEGYSPSAEREVLRAYIWLYVACDAFLDDDAKNAVMDSIVELCWPSEEEYISNPNDYVLSSNNTDAESKLREFLLDNCVGELTAEQLEDTRRYPSDFADGLAVLRTIIQDDKTKGLYAKKAKPCSYHDHRKVEREKQKQTEAHERRYGSRQEWADVMVARCQLRGKTMFTTRAQIEAYEATIAEYEAAQKIRNEKYGLTPK